MKDLVYKYLRGDPATGGVSILRLYLMRLLFILMFLNVGKTAWTEIFTHSGPWDPLHGVTFSFWATYSTLLLLGLRYPLKVVPLLLLQFAYKLVWVLAVAYPLWSSNQLAGTYVDKLATQFVFAMVVDLLLIPWPYVLRSYFLKSTPG
jgi:hypothetical protein